MSNERRFQLATNGLREFFLHVYCADGSICEYGPFASGEDALAQQYAIEHPKFEQCEYERKASAR